LQRLASNSGLTIREDRSERQLPKVANDGPEKTYRVEDVRLIVANEHGGDEIIFSGRKGEAITWMRFTNRLFSIKQNILLSINEQIAKNEEFLIERMESKVLPKPSSTR